MGIQPHSIHKNKLKNWVLNKTLSFDLDTWAVGLCAMPVHMHTHKYTSNNGDVNNNNSNDNRNIQE